MRTLAGVAAMSHYFSSCRRRSEFSLKLSSVSANSLILVSIL